jgi:hypothetical protein
MEQPPPLDGAPKRNPPPADLRWMFFLMLPASLFLINEIAVRALIDVGNRAGMDIHAEGLMFFFIILLPVAPICLIVAIVMALRKKGGFTAFAQGLALNVLLLVAVMAIFYLRGYRF